MKTIILKVEVPDDAEMFSVSYRIPVEPCGLLGYTHEYRRNRNPTEITLPSEEEIELFIRENKATVRTIMSDFADAGFISGAIWLLNKLKS